MTSATVSDPLGSTLQIFDTMVESGLKFQEASMNAFNSAVETARAPFQWPRENGEAVKKASSAIHTSVEDMERAMRENVAAGIEMYEKSFGIRSESNPDGRACLIELGSIGLRAMRANAEAAVRAQVSLLHWWADLSESVVKAGR